MSYSCKSLSNINDILVTSKVLSAVQPDYNLKNSKVDGNGGYKGSSFIQSIQEG